MVGYMLIFLIYLKSCICSFRTGKLNCGSIVAIHVLALKSVHSFFFFFRELFGTVLVVTAPNWLQ